MLGHGCGRDGSDVAIDAVVVQREGRHGADGLAELHARDARADRLDGPRGLVTEPARQAWGVEILAAAKHRLGPIEPQRMDANPDLVLPRRRDFYLFDPQYFGASGLMKTYDACHDTPPAKATNSLVTRARLGRSRPEHGVGQHRTWRRFSG